MKIINNNTLYKITWVYILKINERNCFEYEHHYIMKNSNAKLIQSRSNCEKLNQIHKTKVKKRHIVILF